MTPTQIQAVQRSLALLAPSDSVAAALLHTLAQALKAGAREWAPA